MKIVSRRQIFMRSVKPGRAPSLMAGIVSVFLVIFGIFFTYVLYFISAQTNLPIWLFGAAWTTVVLLSAIYNFYNVFAKKRFSSVDIVDRNEEADPLNEHLSDDKKYCPHCGEKLAEDYVYCPNCGQKVKEEK